MKPALTLIFALVIAAFAQAACPPPPAPGYDGGGSGTGPEPGGEGGFSQGGGVDVETGQPPADLEIGDEVC